MLSLRKMHSQRKSRRTDKHLSIKDSESLDSCIQGVLSPLYPPFSSTAPTLLWQLFSVVERQYHGDGLRCLLDYLLPAKSILQSLQLHSRERFKGVHLFHTGWPLCLQEKVVVQLSPLHKVRLRQGDFYLQLVPEGRGSARLVLKCLALSGLALVEVAVPAGMLPSVFTPAFPEQLTRGRPLHPLTSCLLSSGSSSAVFRTSWASVASPALPRAEAPPSSPSSPPPQPAFRPCSASGSTGTLDSFRSSRDSLQSTASEPVLRRHRDNHAPHARRCAADTPTHAHAPSQRHTHTHTHSHGHGMATPTPAHTHARPQCERAGAGLDRGVCFGAEPKEPPPAAPPRRRSARDSSVALETRRLFRQSYMEALQNPMSLGSSSESVLDEGHDPAGPAYRQPLPRRLCGRGWLAGEEGRSVSPLSRGLPTRTGPDQPPHQAHQPHEDQRPRSKSLDRTGTGRASVGRGHRARSSSGGSASLSPRRLLNGHTSHPSHTSHTLRPASERRSSLREESAASESPHHSGYHRNSLSSDDCNPDQAAPPTYRLHPPKLSDLNRHLLTSGAVTLPGNRERGGRQLLQVCMRSSVWTDGFCSPQQLTCLITYLCFPLRKEKREQGLIVLVDGRRLQTLSPHMHTLLTALSDAQMSFACMLLLVDKECVYRPERELGVPCELLTSLRSLQKHVDLTQLTRDLEGTFPYDHNHYIQFREKIEPFASSCNLAVTSLQNSINSLNNTGSLDTTQEVMEVIAERRRLMKCVLDDSRLNRLRLEGGTFLARIRKEELWDNDNYRDAVDMVSTLYNRVDEEVHRLVIESNSSLQHLEELLHTRRFEEATAQIRHWFIEEGEKHLAALDSFSLSTVSIIQMRRSLDHFMDQSDLQQKQALVLIQSSEGCPSSTLMDFKHFLSAMATRSEKRKADLETLQNLYEFYDSAESWLTHCDTLLGQKQGGAGAGEEDVCPPTVLQELEELSEEARRRLPPERFSSLREGLGALGVGRERERCSALWRQCQLMHAQLEDALKHGTTATPGGEEGDSNLVLTHSAPSTQTPHATHNTHTPHTTHNTHPSYTTHTSPSTHTPHTTHNTHPSYTTHTTPSTHTTHTTHNTHSSYTTHTTPSTHTTHTTHNTHPSYTTHTTPSTHTTHTTHNTHPSYTTHTTPSTHTPHTTHSTHIPLPADPASGHSPPQLSPLGESPQRTHLFLFDEGRAFSKSHPFHTPTGSTSSSPSSHSHFSFPPEGDGRSTSPFDDTRGSSSLFDDTHRLAADRSTSLFDDTRRTASLFDDTDSDCTVDSAVSSRSEPVRSPAAARHRRPPLRKMMKKTSSYEMAPPPREGCGSGGRGYTGVHIRGLEVANNVCVEKTLQRPEVKSPALSRSQSLSAPPRTHTHTHLDTDSKTHNSSKIQHILDEMIGSEREYVRSLSYVIQHYFPEMERPDLPQDLRGKRSVVFGNLEKLWAFHTHHFLKELEQCTHTPLAVSQCFLSHEDQFGMYALYSKNKPRSDALLSSHGNSFFKNKQLELGDHMDVASYLLKPIQRMSKYALLLKDLLKHTHTHGSGPAQEVQLRDLRAAHDLVTFQLRHGNDLLAMDAIKGCDVNLKEQGQLRCQDEFLVWCGRRKFLRHVFLFEDLILFSKTKKMEGEYDSYVYKQSFKTAEIGMTENVGESGLRFEIWFRRRKSQDTFILQAGSPEVKATWTSIIGKILWRQALRNRELRMQEMVSMGIGNKPFMDIKPSDAAISDRAIDYIMKSSESRTRASIAVSSFDHSAPFKRPHSTISTSSTSSSGSQSSASLLGPLNLHLYPSHTHTHTHAHTHPTHPSHMPHAGFSWPYDCIEEDELEQDSASQPSVKTSSSSSQCTSTDSISGHSSVTISAPSTVVMETTPDNPPSFICPASSTPVPSHSAPQTPPSPLYHKEAELQQTNSTFITAL